MVPNPEAASAPPSSGLSVGDVADRYLATFVGKRTTDRGNEWTDSTCTPPWARQADGALRVSRACPSPVGSGRTVRFENKAHHDDHQGPHRHDSQGPTPSRVVGCNRLLAPAPALFQRRLWTVHRSDPFKRHGVAIVRLSAEVRPGRGDRRRSGSAPRERDPHLRSLIVATL